MVAYIAALKGWRCTPCPAGYLQHWKASLDLLTPTVQPALCIWKCSNEMVSPLFCGAHKLLVSDRTLPWEKAKTVSALVSANSPHTNWTPIGAVFYFPFHYCVRLFSKIGGWNRQIKRANEKFDGQFAWLLIVISLCGKGLLPCSVLYRPRACVVLSLHTLSLDRWLVVQLSTSVVRSWTLGAPVMLQLGQETALYSTGRESDSMMWGYL